MTEMMGYERDKRIRRKFGNEPHWAEVGGNHYYFRSKFERRWAQYLELLRTQGHIVEWSYEPQTFVFEGVKSGPVCYQPDFKVAEREETFNGLVFTKHYWQETKGMHDGQTNTKFKRMAEQYPNEPIELVLLHIPKNGKGARRREIAAKYCRRVIDGGKILRQCGL